ncbi:DIP2 disco-interacting protein 2 C [Xenoophorus captivus]|uniref:DIP2 disco-interacting protein 2 C n=1 Tax=Xenoophorus captivus TaxID=1517983 RepID=A0ABV0RUJ9_9TELE
MVLLVFPLSPEIGPASVMVGNLVSGKRIAQASGRDLGQIEDNDQARKGAIASSLTCLQLHKRAEKIAAVLGERGHLQDGDHVALVYPPGIDLIAAFYGCLYAGCVPITVRPPHPQNIATTLPTVKMIVEVSRSVCVMTTQVICKLLRSKEALAAVDIRTWPPVIDTGHQSILIPPSELEVNPALWLSAVSQYKVRDTFCSYSVMELCTKGLGLQTDSLKGTSGPDPTTVYVDMRALRHDSGILQPFCRASSVVKLISAIRPTKTKTLLCLSHSSCFVNYSFIPLNEQILPGVRIIIANPETKGPMGESHLGEIWVHSGHNASGYFTVYGDEVLQSDHFSSRLSFGDTQTVWARTGYLGFLRRTELTDASGERHDALYVVGALEEAMELRGMRYHPIDIETSTQVPSHSRTGFWAPKVQSPHLGPFNVLICSHTVCSVSSAVFTWTNLLVVVVELDGSEHEALDLVPLVTNVVLEEHYLIVGVVVVVDIGVIPINSRGEKQRMHLRDGFLADQLDPIYVAYNM